jgi:hypothetical protein
MPSKLLRTPQKKMESIAKQILKKKSKSLLSQQQPLNTHLNLKASPIKQ